MPLFSGIVAAVGAISSFIGGLGAIGTFVLRTAVGIGLNLLAQAIAGKPKDPTFSINGTLQSGGDLARSFIIGRTATAGSLVWANTWGADGDTPNAFLTQVIALSDYPVSGLEELWVNGEKCTLTTAGDYGRPVPEYVKDGRDNLWVKFYDGTQTAADSFLVGTASNAARQWSSSRVGRGVAYAIVTSRVSGQMFSGIPTFKFVLAGAKLYDISRDSSVGGTGSHRLDDPATWGGDGDHLPAVQAYNLLRGLTWDGKWFYGLQGLAAARLPAANWIAQVNKCRASIVGASGLEPTYRSGGEIQIDAPLASALEAINTTCQGRISEVGGVYSMFVGAPDSPVASFTDGDILSSEEQSFTPFFGLADTINGISATYPSPADGWAAKTAPPLYRTDLEALHGNRRLMADVPLDFVPYAEQVQRLMKSALEEGQRARRHTLVLPPEFWPFAVPGAILAWTSERNGYVGKLFRVDGASDRANLDVMIDITEVDPADYDWNSETDFDVPVDGAVGPIRPQPQPIVDWSAIPAAVTDANGNDRRPAILLGWDGAKDDVDAVLFEVRLGATTEVQYRGRTDSVAAGSLLISPGFLLPNTDYGVRGQYYAMSGREMVWSSWIPVTTPDIRLGPNDVYLDGMVEEINAHVLENLAPLNVNIRDLIETERQIAAAAMEQDAGQYLDKQQSLMKVSSAYENITADYQLMVTAATGPESAIVQRLETLEVEMPGKASVSALNSLTLTVTEQAGDISALGVAINGVQAAVTESLAQGMFRTYVEATQAGALATIGISASATSGGATSQAAILISAIAGGKSMVGLVADQVYMTDNAGNKAYPFVFSGGVMRVNVANIGEVTTGIIRSPDSKFIINLTSKSLEWYD